MRSLCVRTRAAAGHASAAHCCRTLPGPAGLRPAAQPHEMYLHPKMEMTFRKRHVPIRDPIMWKKEENLRVSTEENISHMLDLRMCFKRASGFDFSSTKT